MKSKYLIFVAWGLLLFQTAYAQIPNGDFENWSVSTNYSINTWLQYGLVTAVSPSQQGPYAVKLEHDSVTHSPALVLHGGYDNTLGFVGGIPFNSRPDSINGFFKCYSPNPTDMALMLVIFKKNGVLLSEDYFFIGVSPDTALYQQKKFKINYNHPSEIPDSVIIVLTNPNPFQDSLYSGYLIADNLNFTNTPLNIPNGQFDGWAIAQLDLPTNWMSYNVLGFTGGNAPISRTNDCTSGSFAIRMQNICGVTDTLPGIIISSLGGNWPAQSFTLPERFTSLKGNYKFLPENQDTLLFQIIFFEADTVVGIAYFTADTAVTSYTEFDIPIIYWDNFFGIPDSALIYAAPYRFDNGEPRGASVMYLDNLHFIKNEQLVINEVLSSNASCHYDAIGNAEDWIEIYNAGSSPVIINNYFVSDDVAQPNKWRIPLYQLYPDSFLVVYASGKDMHYPNFHTNFEIAASGESIILSDPQGQTISVMPPANLATDISWGRYPDASQNLVYFAQPTPRASNTSSPFAGFTDIIPQFSIQPGFYTDSVVLSITCQHPNAIVRFTLDGSEPSPVSPVFTTPITLKSRSGQPNTYSMIHQTTPWWGWSYPQGEVFKINMVRAKAFIPDTISTRILSGSYLIDDSIFNRYSLPVVSLITDSMNLFGYEEGIYIRGKIFDEHLLQYPGDTLLFTPANYFMRGDSWERPIHVEMFSHSGTSLLTQDAGLRMHGGASRMFRQKALRIHARNKYGSEYIDEPIFSDHKAKKSHVPIVRYKNLLMRTSGNDNDQTIFRDAFVHQLVKHSSIDVMELQPANVFLNGEFWGIHNFRERQDKYYFEQHYGIHPDSIVILETFGDVTEGPDTGRFHYMNMLAYMNSNSLSNTQHYNYIKTQMDVNNYLDYQSVQIYIRNTDWPGNNIRYWRKNTALSQPSAGLGDDGRWRWILFDTDFGFGQQDGLNDPQHNTLEFATDPDNTDWPNPDWSTFLFRKMLENEAFRNDYINRTADHINTSFKPQRVLDMIDSLQNLYAPDMPEHIYRWHFNGTVNDWHQMIDIMRFFAINRPAYMQQHIMNMWNLPDTYQLSTNVSNPAHGNVKVNSVVIDEDTKGISGLPYPWNGTYFKTIPVPLKAIAKPGYVFKEWENTGITNPEILINPTGDTTFKALFDIDTAFQNISLFINEVMALNNGFVQDEHGESDDWIELYNPGPDTIDIGGFYITDDKLNLTKHALPTGTPSTRIAPQGFLLLWADDTPQQGPLHLPFKLSSNGEFLGVYAPNLTHRDTLSFGYQLGNRSYGRYPDGSTALVTFDTPTPGASNTINSGIEPLSASIPFSIFPNPARHTVFFNKTTDISVFDHTGRLLYEKKNVYLLDVSGLGKGIYFIRDSSGTVKKLVVL